MKSTVALMLTFELFKAKLNQLLLSLEIFIWMNTCHSTIFISISSIRIFPFILVAKYKFHILCNPEPSYVVLAITPNSLSEFFFSLEKRHNQAMIRKLRNQKEIPTQKTEVGKSKLAIGKRIPRSKKWVTPPPPKKK